jgi:hypothetical protein
MINNHIPLVKPYGMCKEAYATFPCTAHDTVARFLPGKVLRVYGLVIDEVVENCRFWAAGEP